jgi:hypothetical protein
VGRRSAPERPGRGPRAAAVSRRHPTFDVDIDIGADGAVTSPQLDGFWLAVTELLA